MDDTLVEDVAVWEWDYACERDEDVEQIGEEEQGAVLQDGVDGLEGEVEVFEGQGHVLAAFELGLPGEKVAVELL